MKKAIRNGLYAVIITSIISLSFGIYDLITGFVEFNIINLGLTLIGAILVGTFLFIPTFVISLGIYYFKKE